MALKFYTASRPRRGQLLAAAPQLIAVGSGSAGNPTFSGNLAADLQQLIMLGTGSQSGGNTDPDANDGLIVSNFASYDPDAAQLISIDVNNTWNNWGTTAGGSIQFTTGSWWNGTANIARMFPPTAEGGSGLGHIPIWKNATKPVRQLNLRFEWRPSSNYCSQRGFPKFMIARTYRQLQAVPSVPVVRPMLYLAMTNESGNTPDPWDFDGPYDIANAIHLVPAQGTNRCYMDYNMIPAPTGAQWVYGASPTTAQTVRCPFYWRATAGVDSAGNPIIPAGEVVVIEVRLQAMATAGEPNGVIGYRVYRQNGTYFERCCGWTWDDNGINVNEAYIEAIEQFGGGYYNVGNPSSPLVYTEVGRRVGIATNFQPSVGRAWIGPPSGFVQV